MTPGVDVLVAAGGNVAPETQMPRAARELARAFSGARFSHAYRNAAVGFAGEDFVNGVVAFRTGAPLSAVLEALHRIEALCGRERAAPKWAPRAMDLDVLLYGDVVGTHPGAVLPRPDLVRRAYMLGPAAELAPERRHPTLGRTLAQLWQDFDRDAHPMTLASVAGWPS
jgi:2-amino-4-hydroxy-6-hydroxymethyldihydropteridine diphosphokinase